MYIFYLEIEFMNDILFCLIKKVENFLNYVIKLI